MARDREGLKVKPNLKPTGFTLIELMVAVAIVGVLSMLAYPSYTQYVLRTHRATAAACLQELALQMERRLTIQMAYNSPTTLPVAACVAANQARYTFSFSSNQPTATTYSIQAVPAGAQAPDNLCGTLSLDQSGARAKTGTADVQSCWK